MRSKNSNSFNATLCFNGANWEIQTLFESQTTGQFKIEKKKEHLNCRLWLQLIRTWDHIWFFKENYRTAPASAFNVTIVWWCLDLLGCIYFHHFYHSLFVFYSRQAASCIYGQERGVHFQISSFIQMMLHHWSALSRSAAHCSSSFY